MGRKRKTDLGLPQRVYLRSGSYYYAHPAGRWENLGKDKAKAVAKAMTYNDSAGRYGTLVYWMDMFLADCRERVKLKSTQKGVKLSERTLADYEDAIGTDEKPGPLRLYFGPPLTPADVEPSMVQDYLRDNAKLDRAVRGNRERACLSAVFGWLLRSGQIPGLKVNPCLRASGVQRNTETKRTRYVTHEEYREVWAVAGRAERLLMALTYRTLQRPESDIIRWKEGVIRNEPGGRFLVFRQWKTHRDMKIAFTPDLDALLPRPEGNVRGLNEPIIATLKGNAYTYDGISSMLRRSIEVANERRRARGITPMESFGFRDLKGKGATDMWLEGTPIEEIQALCGHASKHTTEIYVKQRWTQAVQPNTVSVA
jgi:integrase